MPSQKASLSLHPTWTFQKPGLQKQSWGDPEQRGQTPGQAGGSTTPHLASFASPLLWGLLSRFSLNPLTFSSNTENQSHSPTKTLTACMEEDPRVARTPLTAGITLLAKNFPVASVRENPDKCLRSVAHHVLWGWE